MQHRKRSVHLINSTAHICWSLSLTAFAVLAAMPQAWKLRRATGLTIRRTASGLYWFATPRLTQERATTSSKVIPMILMLMSYHARCSALVCVEATSAHAQQSEYMQGSACKSACVGQLYMLSVTLLVCVLLSDSAYSIGSSFA
jgi:hypothetical protein